MDHNYQFTLSKTNLVNIIPSPLMFNISSANEKSILEMLNIHWHSKQTQWNKVQVVKAEELTDEDCKLLLSTEENQRAGFIHFSIKDTYLEMGLQLSDEIQADWCKVDFKAKSDEHFLGLGERFNGLDQCGNQIDLNVINGASGGKTYKPVPFYISSAGYGLQIETDQRTILRFSTPDEPNIVSIRIASDNFKLRIFPGSSPKDILPEYIQHTGKPPLPPQWVFGPWKSRDWTAENQKTVLEDINETRWHQLAGTVKLIDAAWEPELNTFTFDSQKFPEPEEMIREVREKGFHLILWISPWMVKNNPASEIYQYCAREGFLIKNTEGEPYVHRLGNSPTFVGSCIDFTNPEATAWWKAQIQRLVKMGVEGFKTDFGEQVPEDAVFFDGRTGKDVHNIFPRLYNQATYEAMSEETHGFLLARSAWDGSQAYCGVWAGDQTSDFGPATGLPSVILAGQSAGLSGFPFWASDIGGYFGTPTEEVFTRWSQFGAFSPIMQIHGMGNREPWNFSPMTMAIYKKYAQLHMDLFPYIYTYAHIASQTGLPIMRALALEFPEDASIWGDMGEHEYCFGEEMLVAPVYYGVDSFRNLYLPAGEWKDFWTGEAYKGGKVITAPAPLETIPVFVRTGSIIPMLDPSPETFDAIKGENTRQTGSDLSLMVYPGEDHTFTLYDGTTFEWNENQQQLTLSNSPMRRSISIKIMGTAYKAPQISKDGNEKISYANTNLNEETGFTRTILQPNEEIFITYKLNGQVQKYR